jgi:hypothetical protein
MSSSVTVGLGSGAGAVGGRRARTCREPVVNLHVHRDRRRGGGRVLTVVLRGPVEAAIEVHRNAFTVNVWRGGIVVGAAWWPRAGRCSRPGASRCDGPVRSDVPTRSSRWFEVVMHVDGDHSGWVRPQAPTTRRTRRSSVGVEPCGAVGPSEPGSAVTVYVYDADDLVRGGLADLIDAEDGFVVVGSSDAGHQALADIVRLLPRVAVLGGCAADGHALALCRSVRPSAPAVACVIVTTAVPDWFGLHAAAAGAAAYVLKRLNGFGLIEVIADVAAGGRRLDVPWSPADPS